jgi:hypothetical protein
MNFASQGRPRLAQVKAAFKNRLDKLPRKLRNVDSGFRRLARFLRVDSGTDGVNFG